MPHRLKQLRNAIGALLGAFALSACVTTLPSTGQTSIGGKAVSYAKLGSGKPVIVLQSGLGNGKDTWAGVMPALQAQHTVIAIDRPGYGDSAVSEAPRDACTIAREQHDILQAAGVAPPYLLIGHSLGGLYQFVYAKLYPQEVAGLILIDPTHPRHWETMQAAAPQAAQALRAIVRFGFNATERREFDDQIACLADIGVLVQADPGPLLAPHIQTRILLRSRYAVLLEQGDFERMVHTLEPDWLRMTGAPTLQRVADSGHYIHHERPAVLLEAVRQLSIPPKP